MRGNSFMCKICHIPHQQPHQRQYVTLPASEYSIYLDIASSTDAIALQHTKQFHSCFHLLFNFLTLTQQPAFGWSWITDVAPGLQHKSRSSNPGAFASTFSGRGSNAEGASCLASSVLVNGLWHSSARWVGKMRKKEGQEDGERRMSRERSLECIAASNRKIVRCIAIVRGGYSSVG